MYEKAPLVLRGAFLLSDVSFFPPHRQTTAAIITVYLYFSYLLVLVIPTGLPITMRHISAAIMVTV